MPVEDHLLWRENRACRTGTLVESLAMPMIGEKHRFSRKNVELLAPEVAGVYALYTEDGVAFYSAARGEETIKSCLVEHLWGRQLPGRDEAKAFSFETTRFAMARATALLDEHRRVSRRLPRYNEPPPGSRLLPQVARRQEEPQGPRPPERA
jgi:hypothetical protein